ncbi:hypothetical protein M5D96_013662, partial [Drosophila gunungcola]
MNDCIQLLVLDSATALKNTETAICSPLRILVSRWLHQPISAAASLLLMTAFLRLLLVSCSRFQWPPQLCGCVG